MLRRLFRVLGRKQDANTGNEPTEGLGASSFDHFTDAVDTIKQLKRERRHNEAESLLLWCIEQAEQDEEFTNPPPWYYKHLAIVYRKNGQYEEEIQILERYLNNSTSPREDLQKRLHRARELAENAD